MGNTCGIDNAEDYTISEKNINNYNNIDELAKNFIQNYCFFDAKSIIHSMVLLQTFQKYVENNLEKEKYDKWIVSTNPIDRLNCLLNNLENYCSIAWISFDNIAGIKLQNI